MKSIKKYSMMVLATFIMLGLIGFAEATPTVVSVTPSSLAEADVGNVYVNVTFDEEMNQSQNVTIFVVGITGSPIEVTLDNWNSSTSWIGNFTFSDNNEVVANAFYNISGAMNSSGEVMVALSSRGSNNSLDIDTVKPTVVITMDDVALSSGETAIVTFNFSEAPVNFNESDITSPNGVISDFANSSETNYTATFTPTTSIDDATNVITVGTDWADVAGNAPLVETNSSNYAVETVSPTVVITMSDYAFKVGDTSATVTFNFSEAPIGFNESDITVASGNLSNLTNSSETVYTAIFVPTTDNNTNVITVGTNWTDSGLNYPASQTNSSNYVIDTVVPTVEITEPSSGASVRSTAVISFTSTESVDVECSVDNSNWVDCTSGVTTLGSVTGFSGLSTGAFTLYLRDTDSAGNIGEDSISLTKLSTSSGGGSARSYQVRNNFQAHQSWIMILPNQRILFKPGISENPVEEVNFVMKRNKAALTLNTTGYSLKPAGIREKKGALKYMEINADNLSGADVNGSITVKFSLEKSLTNNSRRIYMFRLVGDTWNKLTTIYLYSNATHYFYSANTPGFSYFAIGEEDVVTTDVSSSAPLAPVTPTAPVASSTQTGEGSAGSDLGSQETAEPQVQENNAQVQDESATKSKFSIGDIKGWIWFLVVVVVLGLLVAISISKSKYR